MAATKVKSIGIVVSKTRAVSCYLGMQVRVSLHAHKMGNPHLPGDMSVKVVLAKGRARGRQSASATASSLSDSADQQLGLRVAIII